MSSYEQVIEFPGLINIAQNCFAMLWILTSPHRNIVPIYFIVYHESIFKIPNSIYVCIWNFDTFSLKIYRKQNQFQIIRSLWGIFINVYIRRLTSRRTNYKYTLQIIIFLSLHWINYLKIARGLILPLLFMEIIWRIKAFTYVGMKEIYWLLTRFNNKCGLGIIFL